MGTGELNESKHINKPVPGGTVIPQYPDIYIYYSVCVYKIHKFIYIYIQYIYIYTVYIYTHYVYISIINQSLA